MASEAEAYLRGLAVDRLRILLPGARIVHELNVETGSCRVDLAAITTERLLLVEIKSRKDKLDRLPEQCATFGPACHRLAVCYASERWDWIAMREKVPYGIDLWPENEPSEWTFSTGYKPPNTSAMLNLLWRDELHHEAVRANLQPRPRTSRAPLMAMLWENLTGREVTQAVCRQLRDRPFAVGDPAIIPA